MLGATVLSLSIVAVLGCGEKAESKGDGKHLSHDKEETQAKGKSDIAEKAANDPVESLRAILASVEKDMATEHLAHFSDPGSERGWIKRRIVLSDMKYDVKKTDSLVSPLLAPVNFKCSTIQSEIYPNKGDAEKAKILQPSGLAISCRATLAFQDGKWNAKSLEYYLLESAWVSYSTTPAYSPLQAIWKSIEKATNQ